MEEEREELDARDVEWPPECLRLVHTPLWITDPDGRLAHVNAEAEELLGIRAEEAVGHPCAAVVGGASEDGPACAEVCELRRRAADGERIAPFLMRVGGDEEGRWMLILPLVLTAPDGSHPWVVHCAQDVDRAHRSEAYLCRVAYGAPSAAPQRSEWPLSARESEILEHLALHEDPGVVARRLFISPVTVRNHVQNILRKLAVHSIQEAVARWLVEHPAAAHEEESAERETPRPAGGAPSPRKGARPRATT